ncbi:MAG: putative toxin-antitoxin system toxin component, PIN family [Bacteroidales bacterium]|nr:putative toxin-antitoxin system toxin component, PIN family [Bacteroidales bacterium]
MRRIVLDTNCLLMALPSQSPYHRIWTDFLSGALEFCVSTEILNEYEEIIGKHSSPVLAEAVIQALINRPNLVKVEPTYFFHLIEADPDDNKFVDCAICGNAELIVTNDAHFNVLKNIDFPIVDVKSIQEFVAELQ